jgi:hypothetical protein
VCFPSGAHQGERHVQHVNVIGWVLALFVAVANAALFVEVIKQNVKVIK